MNIERLSIENIQEVETGVLDISKFKITSKTIVEKPKAILSVINPTGELIDIMTEGNISMIQGKAKSRKSTFLKAVAQAFVTGHNSKMSCDYDRRKICIIDTEQSEYDSFKVVEVIKAITGVDIDYFNVSTISVYDRKRLVELYLEDNPDCGLMILDNIVHFLINFNDATESSELLQWIMKTKNLYKVHINVILHENSGDYKKARGHLGTNLVNMCETIIRIEKDPEDKNQSIVSPVETRGMEFEPFAVTRDWQGIPYLSDLEPIEVERRNQKNSPFSV